MKQNIDAALRIARALWLLGYVVICPHGNTYFMDGPDIPDNTFLQGDLEILSRCDLLVTTPHWDESVGARGEVDFALTKGIPVYHWPFVPSPEHFNAN